MSKQKLTPWFPADVKPVHVGWYHTKISHTWFSGRNWYWDGKLWRYEPDGAKCLSQKKSWRGLITPIPTAQPQEKLL